MTHLERAMRVGLAAVARSMAKPKPEPCPDCGEPLEREREVREYADTRGEHQQAETGRWSVSCTCGYERVEELSEPDDNPEE